MYKLRVAVPFDALIASADSSDSGIGPMCCEHVVKTRAEQDQEHDHVKYVGPANAAHSPDAAQADHRHQQDAGQIDRYSPLLSKPVAYGRQHAAGNADGHRQDESPAAQTRRPERRSLGSRG
jgi:hypothetical protein